MKMRLILLTLMMCAGLLAADAPSTTQPKAVNDARSMPKAARSRHTFHPLRLLRRLGKTESEFAFRLSSWGIPREGEAVNSKVLPRPILLTETSASMPQGPPGGASR